MTQFNFNPNEYESIVNMNDVVPKGKYTCVATKVEQKGACLNMMFNILDGDHKNRKIFQNFNVYSENPVSKEIALRLLSTYCKAAGIGEVQQIAQLCNKPLILHVDVMPATQRYNKENNKIVGYSPLGDTSQVETSTPTPTAQPETPKAPWDN